MRIHIECRKVFLPRLSNRWRPHQTLNFGASSKDPLHPHLHSHLPPHPHIVNMETNLHFALKTRKKALCGFNGLGARDVVRPFQTLCQHFQHHIHGAERMCAREWRQRNKRNRDRGTRHAPQRVRMHVYRCWCAVTTRLTCHMPHMSHASHVTCPRCVTRVFQEEAVSRPHNQEEAVCSRGGRVLKRRPSQERTIMRAAYARTVLARTTGNIV